MTIMQAIAGGGEQDADGQANSALSTEKMDLQSPGLDKKAPGRTGTTGQDTVRVQEVCAGKRSHI